MESCSTGKVLYCMSLRVLLREGKVDKRLLLHSNCRRFGLCSGHDLDVGTGCVILILAIGQDRVSTRSSRPLPNPIQGHSLASGCVGWNGDISFAPLLYIGIWLTRNSIRELLLSLLGDWTGVDLVAAAIVKVLSCEETALTIPSFAIVCPLHDVCELCCGAGGSGAEDEDSASTFRLALLVVRKCDMSVFQVLHSDKVAWASGEHGKSWCLVGNTLRWVAEKVSVVDSRAVGG